MKRVRVLIADDHVLLLDAFERLLEPEFEVVGKATNGRELVKLALELQPEVIVGDMSMPELNGLEAARQVLSKRPETRIVLLTVHEDEVLAADALRAGVAGFVVKRSAAGELQRAIHDVLAGKTYLTPLVAGGDVESLAEQRIRQSPVDRLTPREREVLQLLAEGCAMKEIGARLGITARTVAFHKYKMMETLELKTTAELVRFAVENRIA
ncbi:MAG: DNA-binding response regulator [Acidobacteria bacterium]|nr:MAG: DNA-binding response regulator [Acidobacteriota bacterium]RLE27357.1 MAG: DNA-binding response regulator [Acidobacteriota bacterium]